MEVYIVKQYTDGLYVERNGIEYLTIKRKFNWAGKVTSQFFLANELILETGYDIFLFRKFLWIKFQNLPVRVELKKKRRI